MRRLSVALLAVVLLGACELAGGMRGTVVDPRKELPAFAFTRADGRPFSTAPEPGRPTVVLFGYTHCPDVCPTTLADWKRVKEQLGADAARVRFLFVSVDRERDTPAISQAYAARFDAAFVGVTGDSATLVGMQRAFGVASFHEHAAPVAASNAMPAEAGGTTLHLVNHTTATFLLDERGRLVSVHSPGSGWDALAFNLERLL